MSDTNKEYCNSECSEQCEDDDICNQECMEYCMNNDSNSNSKSGMFSMLFSRTGLISISCCCFLLIGICLFFLFKKDSKQPSQYNPQTSYNPNWSSPMQPMQYNPQMSYNPNMSSPIQPMQGQIPLQRY